MSQAQHQPGAVDLRPTIVPKSDQLNADDLIGRTLTVTITRVARADEPDQPIAIYFDGDGGKPYKPCKSMRRVLVHVWGPDGRAYVGRSMTLYRDDRVQFGGLAVGGIRISHMSDMERETTMALTATRANRKPYTVKPLRPAGDSGRRQPPAQTGGEERGFPGDQPNGGQTTQSPPASDSPPLTLEQRSGMFEKRLREAPTETKVNAVWNANGPLRDALEASDPDRLAELERLRNERLDELSGAGDRC